MTPADFVTVIQAEASRFHDLLSAEVARDAVVPSCPGWTGSDLLWHLAEVHDFWTHVVETRPDDPETYEDPQRPDDGALPAFAIERMERLLAALRAASPDDRCWSWVEGGGSVGWVARRQAHEALIHRVDAELTVGQPVADAEVALAADGVDEMVDDFLGDVPAWASFTAEGIVLALELTDAGVRRTMEFGRFTGTSPDSGRTYDLDHARPTSVDVAADTRVSGTAWQLDRWVWGRAATSEVAVDGDPAVANRLRTIIAETTQ